MSTKPVSITMTDSQWRRIYWTIVKSSDPTPTARSLAYKIDATIRIEEPNATDTAEELSRRDY